MRSQYPVSSDPHVQLLAARAHFMRAHPTESEAALWRAIRGRRLGVAFRRQVPLGAKYIVDFLAPPQRLVVEVDREIHVQRVMSDARRDAFLVGLGYRVLRLEAELVLRQLPVALARIQAALGSAR